MSHEDIIRYRFKKSYGAFHYALDNLETPSHDIPHKYATIVANRINEDVAGIG
jgi:hypothetical protein